MSKAPAPPVTLTCQHEPCGKAFTIPPWEVLRRGRERRFCSPKCGDASRRKITSEKAPRFNRKPAPSPSDLTRACQQCGATFRRSSLKSEQRFCSQPCRAKAQNGVKPPAGSQPVRSTPKPDPDGLVWSGSNLVDCHGCGRTRERGRRCQCERVEGIAS